MFQRLEDVQHRMEELDARLMDPAVARDPTQLRKLNQERSHAQPILEVWTSLEEGRKELAEAKELLYEPDMKELATEEIKRLEREIPELEARLRRALIPPDPYEGRDLILEIRAGTGGDEAALFAGDLFRMYSRFCDLNGWKVEVLSANEITVGGAAGKSGNGFKEIVCQVAGSEAYMNLRHESGVHRVQRVPLTESQGRIHTSAATVAILPEAESVEVDIRDVDLKIDTFRASGAGGQHVNTTDSAVRITHLPTGIVVQCQDERSQHKNKAKAMKVLAARMLEAKERAAHDEAAADRKQQVGSGDRSERIRTYNYPQNRLTDHRIGLTLYNLDRIVAGDLSSVVNALNTTLEEQLEAGFEGA